MMRGVLRDDLAAHLRRFSSAPFLFVGAGMSKRYLGLDSWESLLRRYAAAAGRDYEYYSSTAAGDYPRIASLIAEDLHEKWWADDDYAESRERFKDHATTPQSALKIEIARGLANVLGSLPEEGPLAEELARFAAVTVDGLVTTNYDPLLRRLFPTYEVFIGQDQMLFANPQGVGEIYNIHGSCEDPNSIVLTAEDYARFDERNPYLAAKLLTIFVEHPVVFLGYSLTDPNVTGILRSIASVLTNKRIGELQDRLIFVQWAESPPPDQILTPTPFVTDGYTIPLRTVTVSDYTEVFEALGSAERRFPARLLRQLKDRVYELVRTSDPVGALKVVDIDAETDTSEIDVVFGVGAVEQFNSLGLVGLTRKDLLVDVLRDGGGYPAARLVEEALPGILRRRGSVPVFKYLRAAGLLNDDGTLKDPESVDPRLAERVRNAEREFQPPPSMRARAAATASEAGNFTTLADLHDPEAVLMAVALLGEESHDTEALRRYLIAHRGEQFDRGVQPYATQWAKAVCLFDWLKYGRNA